MITIPWQLADTNIHLELGERITLNEVKEINPDIIICAVGSRPYLPHVEGMNDPRIILADDLFKEKQDEVGNHSIVFDFNGDWAGIESAIFLAEKGSQVTLITAKLHIGQEVHQYLRNPYMKRLYDLNIEMKIHHDFGGISNDKVIARNLFTHQKIELENWDQVVLAYGRVPNAELYEDLKNFTPHVYQIGDCLAPRTIEEATCEGLETVLNLQNEMKLKLLQP